MTSSSGDIVIKSLTATDALSVTGGTFKITNPSTISGQFNLNGGAQLIATGANAVFTATGSVDINNGRFLVAGGGKVLLPGATEYDTSGLNPATIVSVKDAGSLLDLSSVETMKVGKSYDYYTYYYYFEALDNGTVDLSSVTTLESTLSGSNDYAKFTTTNGGKFILTNTIRFIPRLQILLISHRLPQLVRHRLASRIFSFRTCLKMYCCMSL